MYPNSVLAVATALLSLASAQSTTLPITGILGNASIVSDNPAGVVYTATLPTTEFFNPSDPRGNIKGSVSGVAGTNGVGVTFSVSFSNLPTSGGPFLYHIHSAPVPADGNCTDTLAHLDPYIRGEIPPCNDTIPQTCQVGDLSGKHGMITSDPFTASYVDDFASTVDGIGAFFGNRSLTLHFGNTTRITCANFSMAATSTTGGANATSTGTPIQFTGAAAPRGAVSGFALGAVGALALLL